MGKTHKPEEIVAKLRQVDVLTSQGARKVDLMFAAVLPSVLASFINSRLFALEKAVPSSVVLGLVGAGGIGRELSAAVELFQDNRNRRSLSLSSWSSWRWN